MSNDIRFFLAHDKATPDATIDEWRDLLTEQLNEAYPDHEVTVVAGRDDYKRRAQDVGGWQGWSRSVPEGKLLDGSPRFHGIIRPAQRPGDIDVTCGRPTHEMIDGFISQRKMVWAWDTKTHESFVVEACCRLPGDSYTAWGRLVLTPAQTREG